MKSHFVIATFLTFVATLGWAQPGPSRGSDADRQAIMQVRQQEIAYITAGDLDKAMSVYADDVVVMAPGEAVRVGKTAARGLLQQMFTQFKVDGSYTSSADLTISGDVAYERMAYALMMTPTKGGVATLDIGKCVHIYRRQADGSWKIAQDIWNSDKPSP